MIIDLHFHTKKYSSCSKIELEEGIRKAKEIGLDGIIITEHDIFPGYDNLALLEDNYRIKIFVGVEIFTSDGDILCFGLDKLPETDISALELVDHIHSIGGASIAAHPYRDNDRGIKDKIMEIKNLTAIEAYNGNTSDDNNRMAYDIAHLYDLKTTGSSDSHVLEKIGCFATEFDQDIHNMKGLINALRNGIYRPVRYDYTNKSFRDIF